MAFPVPSEEVSPGPNGLVISCPCALGIAAPIVKVAALAWPDQKGFSSGTLRPWKGEGPGHPCFDKTGTLTEGNYSLNEVVSGMGSGMTRYFL